MTRLPLIFLSVLIPFATAEEPASAGAKATVSTAPTDTTADHGIGTVEAPAVIVHESRLMTDQLKDLQQGPLKPQPRPTLTQGGVLLRVQRGKTEIQAGAEDWKDLFEKDAKFQSDPHVIRIELLRLKR